MKFRVEKKFLCNAKDCEILKSRAKNIMNVDSNSIKDGDFGYLIRSIYFDDIYNSNYFENEDGVNNRSKYRIRSYNCDESYINLECKSKINGFTNKISTEIDLQNYSDLLDDNDLFNFSENALLNKINILKTSNFMRKSLVIEYSREAYVCEEGNVRVTFDTSIGVSCEFDNFFKHDIHSIPILETGQFILEIKYDEYIPKYVAQALEINNLQQITFSKFYMGKKLLCSLKGGFTNEL